LVGANPQCSSRVRFYVEQMTETTGPEPLHYNFAVPWIVVDVLQVGAQDRLGLLAVAIFEEPRNLDGAADLPKAIPAHGRRHVEDCVTGRAAVEPGKTHFLQSVDRDVSGYV
jgi:hypothetical protein